MSTERKYDRKSLIFYLKVFGKKTNNLIGELADISPEGIKLISDKPIKEQALFQLKMDLPRQIEGRKEISFDAKSAWCKKNNKTNYYDAGFQLTRISPSNVQRIEFLIKDYCYGA